MKISSNRNALGKIIQKEDEEGGFEEQAFGLWRILEQGENSVFMKLNFFHRITSVVNH